MHIRQPTGDGRAQRERVARRGAAARSQRLISLRESASAARSRPPRRGAARRASSTRRAGTARSVEQTLRHAPPRHAQPRRPPALRRPRLRASRGPVRQPARGSRWPSTCPARTRSPIESSSIGRETARRRGGDNRLTARDRMHRRGHANRAARTSASTHARGGERVRPLLFLQIGDGGGILRCQLLSVCPRGSARRRTP